MKQQLPAKFAKMTVCTFWILKQLKSMGILDEEKMGELSEHFHLFQDSEDQMLFFKDLVENFKEHEDYLKMYVGARKLKKDDDDNEEKQAKYEAVPEKKKELTESEIIQQLLDYEDDEEDAYKNEKVVPTEVLPPQKPKIKLIIKKKI